MIANLLLRPRRGYVLAFLVCFTFQPALAEALMVNPDTTTYDYYPSSSAAADGSTWIAWHGYENGRDQIVARHMSAEGGLGKLHTVSESGSVHGPPKVVAENKSRVSVVWTSKADDTWSVLLREFRDGQWRQTEVLSDAGHDAIYPSATSLKDGRLIVAWSELVDNHARIRGCIITEGQALNKFSISSEGLDAFRGVLVSHGDEAWAIWDQYEQSNYSVHARRVFPELSEVKRVSPADAYCLTPTALSHSSGLYVAWLRKQDVIGGPGVISQLHTLQVARRQDNGDGGDWEMIVTPDGDSDAAELTQGLMAQIEPRPIATGGYLGPRTRPSLLADGDRVWLLWERKSTQQGSTPTVSGDWVGRPIRNGQWDTPVILSKQRIDYHLVDPPTAHDGRVRALASRLPRKGLRRYETFAINLQEAEPFQQDKWIGWSPVELPIRSESPNRRSIRSGDKIYQLFWSDLHCHNGLTADAEGEPDEMHAYARDRAELDVVVFTNNDFYNVPLTQYEFELGNLLANYYSAKVEPNAHRLLSLPGFEWTSRIPGVDGAALSDSGNWLPPYKNRSYPNHRSVLYPPAGGPLVHFTEVGNDIARLNEAVENAGGITLSQHNAFKLSGHSVEVAMELTSGWSNYIASHPRLFHQPLTDGAKLAFTANGDSHRRAPGLSGALTGIYAESLTADDILDALRSRRCFATMGAKIFVDARAGGTLMGQEAIATDGRVTLTLSVIGTRAISHAVLVRDGEEVHRVGGDNSRRLETTFTDQNLPKGTHWYYWRISQARSAPVLPGNLMPAHGHLAWSTPNWVVVK